MRYEAPETLDAATALLVAATGEARVLAGGTDLLVQIKTDMIDPALVVDLKRIAEMRKITKTADGFTIGAAVSGAELKEHTEFKKHWPGLVEAANLIGSTQIQGRATLGGNLCNASPAADSVPAMIAAGARASIFGPKGRRELAVEDVVLAPRKTALEKGEFIVSFHLPLRTKGMGDAYLRFIPAHRDGHCGRRRGRCRCDRCLRRYQRRPRRLGCRRGSPAAGQGRGRRARRFQARRRRARQDGRCRPRCLQAD